MDPPLRHWRAQTVKSGSLSDGGEILAFDYAEADRESLSDSKNKSEPLFQGERAGALKTQNVRGVYYDLKTVYVVKEVGWMFCDTKVTLLSFSYASAP